MKTESHSRSIFFKKHILSIVLLQFSLTFTSLSPSTPYPHTLWQSPFSSCLWIMRISSLATPFPILFLISLCLFCNYLFVLPNPCTFPPNSLPSPSHLVAIQMISIFMILFLFCLFAQFVF